MVDKAPLGIQFLGLRGSVDTTARYKAFILVLTFFCYTSYHLSRKPISIVKAVLHRKNCSVPLVPGDPVIHDDTTDCDWGPFDHDNYSTLLGSLDLAYLFAYAVAMFFSGHIAERMNLRHFLSIGMISSGIMTAAFGFGYFFGIHALWYYILVQIIGGIVQSSGWPSVVACMGNWYGKGKRGLIMGIWNSHTSVGNILGSLIAGAWVNDAWGWSFVVPGIIIGTLGVIVFFFLIPDPDIIGCKNPVHHTDKRPEVSTDMSSDVSTGNNKSKLFPDYKNGGKINLAFNESNVSNKPKEHILTAKDTPHYGAVVYTKGASEKEVNIDLGSEAVVTYNIEGINIGCDINTGTANDKSQGGAFGVSTNPLIRNGVVVKEEALINKNEEEPQESKEAITIWRALRIPGVIEFSLCLFFAKLVSYTFLFWLPKYISAKTSYDAEVAGDLSTLFDVGGILGGIIAGVVSDYTRGRASTCCVMLLLAAPMMYIYNMYGSINYAHSVGLLLCCGFMVNGPYALITTAVSADLGTHKSLRGNSKALATVTAIIDGTGSIGAAIGPLLTGVISKTGWNNVFWMLISADICAMLFLIRLIFKEVKLWSITGCSQELDDVTINVANK